MAQVLEFKLPDLGEGLTEAEIVRWLVEVGDVVAIDQPVVEVETAKAMVEVPCPYGGVVTARFGEEGTELPVGAPLLTVAVEAPAGPETRPGAGPAERRRPRDRWNASGSSPARRTGGRPVRRRHPVAPAEASGCPGRRWHGRPAGAPRRVRPPLAGRQPPASGHVGPVAAPVAESASGPNGTEVAGPVPVISPFVRRLARENGLDLRELTGSGPEGLILRADVDRAIRQGPTAGAVRSADPAAPTLASADAAGAGRGEPGAAAGCPRRRRRQALPQPARDP